MTSFSLYRSCPPQMGLTSTAVVQKARWLRDPKAVISLYAVFIACAQKLAVVVIFTSLLLFPFVLPLPSFRFLLCFLRGLPSPRLF